MHIQSFCCRYAGVLADLVDPDRVGPFYSVTRKSKVLRSIGGVHAHGRVLYTDLATVQDVNDVYTLYIVCALACDRHSGRRDVNRSEVRPSRAVAVSPNHNRNARGYACLLCPGSVLFCDPRVEYTAQNFTCSTYSTDCLPTGLISRTSSLANPSFHVTRHSSLEKDIILGTMPRKRRQGGQKKQWFDDITQWTGQILV